MLQVFDKGFSFTPLNVLEIGGACALIIIIVGLTSLYVGSYKARRAFRSKGFLRPPSGTAWFRFLLFRHYEYFENSTIRLCFGTSHICLIAGFFVIGGMVLFFGTEYMFNGMGGLSLSGPGTPKLEVPQ